MRDWCLPQGELRAVTPNPATTTSTTTSFSRPRAEHARFVAILERFSKVYHVKSLLLEILDRTEVRELLIREAMDIAQSEPLARELTQMSAETVVTWLIEGRDEPLGPLATTLNETGYQLPPSPNLFSRGQPMSTRHVMIVSMRYDVRWSKSDLRRSLRTIPSCHRAFCTMLAERPDVVYTRGRDVYLSPDTVMIRFSDRSSPSRSTAAELLFATRRSPTLIVLVMPKKTRSISTDLYAVDRSCALCTRRTSCCPSDCRCCCGG